MCTCARYVTTDFASGPIDIYSTKMMDVSVICDDMTRIMFR